MKRLIPSLPLLLATALLSGIASLPAEPQTITFAVPEVDGTISLGVYNAEKKLVRTLATNATEKDFQIGLNGLITTWDGKNDAGEALPAGQYTVKGYVVSDRVKSEGEAFHFNDWVVDEDSPRLANPFVLGSTGPFIYLAGDAALGGYATEDKRPWKITALFTEPDQLKLDTEDVTVGGEKLSGKLILIPDLESLKKSLFNPEGSEANVSIPPNLTQIAMSGRDDRVVSDGKSVWIYRGGKFNPVPLGHELQITSLAVGVGDTFWVVAQPVVNGQVEPALVLQYSFTGEVLRQLAGDFANTQIYAEKSKNRIFLTRTIEPATTVIKGLAPATVGETHTIAPAATATPTPAAGETDAPKTADWEVFLEKTSTLCPKFGLVDGKLVPDAGDSKQEDGARLDLPPSTMDQKQHTLVVHGKANKDGEIWLTGSGGLRLALVGKLPGANRVVLAKGDGPGKLKVYAGNGVVVAEYLVSGLDEIAQFNAGEIDLP